MLEKTFLIVLAVIFGGIVLHAPLSVGFGVLFPEYALAIKSWKEILILIAGILAVLVVTRRQLWRVMANDWLFRLISFYVLLHLVWVGVFYEGILAALAGLAVDLRYVLFFVFMYVALKAVPGCRRLFVTIALAGASIVVGFAALQLFLPADILGYVGYGKETIAPYLTVDKNPDYVRVNSTLRGPNPLGAYAGMMLALIAAAAIRTNAWRRDRRLMIAGGLFALCSAVALWISYSRSALVAGIIAVGVVVATTILRRLSRKAWVIVLIVLVSLFGALVAGRDSHFVSNVLFHENPAGGSDVSSNEEHAASLGEGTRRLLEQPFGAGIGSTGSASLYGAEPIIIENQYLFIAHEIGWLGLALFLAIFVIIMWRLWQRRADWLALGAFGGGVGLALIGLLLPVWADDTVSIIWWGLAALALTGGKNERKTTE